MTTEDILFTLVMSYARLVTGGGKKERGDENRRKSLAIRDSRFVRMTVPVTRRHAMQVDVDPYSCSGYRNRSECERGADMVVRLQLLALLAGSLVSAGCAGTWDTVSSQKFRESPFKTLFTSEDPMTVLRTKVEGNERADAMRRLKEPKLNGESDQVQDEALQMLATAATSDPSPIVRTAAIDALGKFRDPRAVNILIAAYHKADGMPTDRATPGDLLQQVGGRRSDSGDPLTALGPMGFEPTFVTTIRSRTATALSQTNSPEAVAFLTGVAAGGRKSDAGSEPDDRDVRSAAVRGLGQMRSKEAVIALARVLKDEAGRDVVLAQNAHVGLKELTGKQLPADPDQWNQVVQAGVEIQPEPNSVLRAINWVTK